MHDEVSKDGHRALNVVSKVQTVGFLVIFMITKVTRRMSLRRYQEDISALHPYIGRR